MKRQKKGTALTVPTTKRITNLSKKVYHFEDLRASIDKSVEKLEALLSEPAYYNYVFVSRAELERGIER